MKVVYAIILRVGMVCAGVQCSGQVYSTTWVGNSYGDNTNHVGNCARSMWVATNGVVYTASLWDENSRDIGVYSNGLTIGGMGGTSVAQGSCIAGDNNDIFVELQQYRGIVGRFKRSNGANDLTFTVSTTTNMTMAGVAGAHLGGIVDQDGRLLYISDTIDNLIQVWSTGGISLYQWSVPSPGAIAMETNRAYLWVAQMATGTLTRYSTNGTAGTVIAMGANSRPSALYINGQNQLWVGDQGPDMNIKIYTNLTSSPQLSGTFGVTGGYLSTNGGAIMGMTGPQRFTRVVGIGGDNAGNMYVLNNPWGGTWDLARNGGTDLHCYSSAGTLLWRLQSLNFEGVGAADPGTGGTNIYSGEFVFSGAGAGDFWANTVNPFLYPADNRINTNSQSRGEDFASIAYVGTNRILATYGQNPDGVATYYFNAANGYIAIPGQTFGLTGTLIRNGFQLELSTGDLWLSYNKSGTISHYPLTGFNTNGQPIWGAPASVPTPASIAPLTRVFYLPASDTMILAGAITNTDWTSLGNTVQVYKGWVAGNTSNPNPVITLNGSLNPKSLTAAGNYLFIGYVHTVPNIDVYNLTTGALELTMTNANPTAVYVGTDVDSMYGLTAYKKPNGQYLICKDNYNGSSIVMHAFTPAGLPVITGMSPASPVTGSSGAQTLTLAGVNFQAGCTVTLTNLDTGGSSSPAVTFINSSNLTISASLSVEPHNWSIQLINPGNVSSAPFTFAVQTPPQPKIGSVSVTMDGTQAILDGTNGTAGLTYYVVMSTNMALPLSSWTPVATNVFGAGGAFVCTNSMTPSAPQSFYVIRL